ncbi:hypothetical protein C8Q73DRAFT_313597 [Cubamyces lactineus]|nr:hypothetical protein C8Q73DRAFT_313597 [Cubamyces lactineus]
MMYYILNAPGHFRWIIGARISTVLTDAIVLAITISKTRALRTEAAAISFVSTIADILARDGTLYFVVLLLANLVGLSLVKSFELIQPMSTWIAILTAIMTSRFILDLHEAADPRAGHDACADLRVGTLSTTMRFPGSAPGSLHARRTPSISIVFGTSTYASDWPRACDAPDSKGDEPDFKAIQHDSECANREQLPENPEMPRRAW